ncbi:hypothetical protein CALVIDRAFT_309677 [Calocera viscosa TUFC12733]|uniref:Uncharacterized protein n=1 Tax=Calocera viscosa (strain TUFC12733) TaxID=1330018 RepID=A0A167I8G2_CALVF|nr:hypothetical protein CALVIDRAFT_309677 [Calocera viscosa TUFC12733]
MTSALHGYLNVPQHPALVQSRQCRSASCQNPDSSYAGHCTPGSRPYVEGAHIAIAYQQPVQACHAYTRETSTCLPSAGIPVLPRAANNPLRKPSQLRRTDKVRLSPRPPSANRNRAWRIQARIPVFGARRAQADYGARTDSSHIQSIPSDGLARPLCPPPPRGRLVSTSLVHPRPLPTSCHNNLPHAIHPSIPSISPPSAARCRFTRIEGIINHALAGAFRSAEHALAPAEQGISSRLLAPFPPACILFSNSPTALRTTDS